MSIYVFGGSTIDIAGFINHKVIKSDSNLGDINFSFGGVGHNVAVNLAMLKEKVHFISVLGDDALSKAFLLDCNKRGIDTSDCLIVKNSNPSFYMSVQSASKDMAIAINDMKIFDKLKPSHVAHVLNKIKENDLVFVDTNLTIETITYILKHSKGKVFVDPVSTVKGKKLKGLYKYIYAFKPNVLEAKALSNKDSVFEAGKWFVKQGISRVFISSGSKGVYVFSKQGNYHQKPYKVEIRNVTGAGDALMAGIIYQEKRNKSIVDVISFGSMMAKYSIESEHTFNEKVTVNKINKSLMEEK